MFNKCCCFKEGTLVETENGLKPIEEIEVGDKVLAYDETTGEQAYKPVVRLFRNTTKEWQYVYLEGETEPIISTPGHKYYLPNNNIRREEERPLEHASYYDLSEKWVSACKLKKGDKVLLSDGKYGIVKQTVCVHLTAPETTYNLEVADFHTYYVGEKPVLVHNSSCGRKHGNSLNSDKKTDLYVLVDKDNPGIIKKIGETTRGSKRYTKKFYMENNVSMKRISSGTKRQMHYAQNRLLHKYYDKIGRLPRLNKGFW